MGRVGVRSEWSAVPSHVRVAVDRSLGSHVVATTTLVGGFSPGPAVRAELADGRTVFIKAAGLGLNPHTPGMHRREAEVLAHLPTGVPAPRLLDVYDDGDWVVVIIEWLDGRSPDVRRADDVDRAVKLLADIATSAAGSAMPVLQPFLATLPEFTGRWAALADDSTMVDRLDARAQRHLDRLVAIETDVAEAVTGETLVHADARTDNMILTTDMAVLVDWPSACLGAPWIDLVACLPALYLDGGPPPDDTLSWATADGRFGDVDEGIDAFLAALAGFFIGQSLLPDPPGLPTVRAFQAAQGEVTTAWLLDRLGLD